MEDNKKCYLCDRVVKTEHEFDRRSVFKVNCQTCGHYNISLEATLAIKHINQRYVLSALTREQSKKGSYITILTTNIKTLLESVSVPKDPLEQIDRILLYIIQNDNTAKASANLLREYYPIAFAKDESEFEFLCDMARKLEYIYVGGDEKDRIDIKGWRRLAELKKTRPDTNKVFIAMWFGDKTDKLREALKAGVEAAGYEPIIVDERAFTGNIMNYVLARIRESKFVVADFTVDREKQPPLTEEDEPDSKTEGGTRGGVYYEAGFAKGLGLGVIHICKGDNISKNRLHFDIKQDNTIFWKNKDVEDNKVRSYKEREAESSPKNLSETLFDFIVNIYGHGKNYQKNAR